MQWCFIGYQYLQGFLLTARLLPLTSCCTQPTHLTQVVTHLKRLAVSMGRMVVFTIHQPNSDITDLFDELLLLSPGGRSAYRWVAWQYCCWL